METANWNLHEIPFVFTAQWRRLVKNKCWQGYVAAKASHYAPRAEIQTCTATLAEAWQFRIGASSTSPPSNRPPRDSSGFCSHYDICVTLECVNLPNASLPMRGYMTAISPLFVSCFCFLVPVVFLKTFTHWPFWAAKSIPHSGGCGSSHLWLKGRGQPFCLVPGQPRLQRESLSQNKQQQITPVSSQAGQGSRSSFSPVDLHLPLLLFCLCVFTSFGPPQEYFFFCFITFIPDPLLYFSWLFSSFCSLTTVPPSAQPLSSHLGSGTHFLASHTWLLFWLTSLPPTTSVLVLLFVMLILQKGDTSFWFLFFVFFSLSLVTYSPFCTQSQS